MYHRQALRAGLIGAALICWAALAPKVGHAEQKIPISLELALAVDTSLSVDDAEYDLQMKGIANAFRQRDIIALIGQHDGVAVTLFQWSTSIDEQFMVPWHLLTTPESVLSFADQVERAPRDPVHGFTAIGKAIDFATRQIAGNQFAGRQLKIDVSGDGRNNSGVLPVVAKRQARVQRIVINGLPILVDTFNLDTYFREQVMHGPGAFVETATDYEDFARAFLRKLTRELSPTVSLRTGPLGRETASTAIQP